MATQAETRTDTGATLGLERWVQFAFIGAALFAFWFLDHLTFAIWNLVEEPDPTLVSAVAAVVAVVGAFVSYRAPTVNEWAHEVAAELSKVTWPGRRQTWSATVVVLIVTAIAATLLGVMDAAWAWVTDLIYDV